jgi:dihydropteroate synthase
MPDLLIEPLGLLHGEVAVLAMRAGAALPLQGGSSAFSLARLIGEPGDPILPVAAIPGHWHAALTRVTTAPPATGLPDRPLVMGILNATPDSFSDGGRHLRAADAIAAGRAMIEAGADILDLGGESTRPGAAVIDPPAEQARILPVLAALRGRGALLSVDTRNAATMRAALDAGADLINDISALAHDPAAAGFLASGTCPVVLMHMRGTPVTMTGLAHYGDLVAEVIRELETRIDMAVQAGIARSRIIVDPGIGFAKDDGHNLELLRRMPALANLGCRVLLGTSRKRFIGRVADVALPAARDPGTLVSSLPGLALPGCILRVHNVPSTVQAVRVWQAIQG